MQGKLDTTLFTDVQSPVDHRGRGAPVLVNLEATDTGVHLRVELVLVHRAALAEQADVDRELIQRLEDPGDVPRARGHGGRRAALGGAGAAADESGHARGQGLVDLFGADEVNVGVHTARGEDPAVAGDDLGARPDHEVCWRHRRGFLRGPTIRHLEARDLVHRLGVVRLADGMNFAVPDADVGLDHTPPVEDQRPRDDGVHREAKLVAAPVPRDVGHAHRLPDHLPATEDHFVAAVLRSAAPVGFDLDGEIGVGEADAVLGGGPVQSGVVRPLQHVARPLRARLPRLAAHRTIPSRSPWILLVSVLASPSI